MISDRPKVGFIGFFESLQSWVDVGENCVDPRNGVVILLKLFQERADLAFTEQTDAAP